MQTNSNLQNQQVTKSQHSSEQEDVQQQEMLHSQDDSSQPLKHSKEGWKLTQSTKKVELISNSQTLETTSSQEGQELDQVDYEYLQHLEKHLPIMRQQGLKVLDGLPIHSRIPLSGWTNLHLCPNISPQKQYEIALIDSDVLRYELGAITTNHAFVKGYRIPAAAEFIHKRCEEKILRINASTNNVKHMCIFSGSGNFRHDIATVQQYKGNRVGMEKPEHWVTVNDFLKETQPHAVVNDREADDYLAERQRRSGNTIICTRDKDLLVTPGWHYRWSCGENQPEVPPHFVSEWEGWFNFFVQCLIGDTTDHIIGCGERRPTTRAGKRVMWRFGVGKKAAKAMLENCHNQYAMYQTVRMEYDKLFGEDWEWRLLENARLLFVGQRADDLFDWSWLNKEWT